MEAATMIANSFSTIKQIIHDFLQVNLQKSFLLFSVSCREKGATVSDVGIYRDVANTQIPGCTIVGRDLRARDCDKLLGQ